MRSFSSVRQAISRSLRRTAATTRTTTTFSLRWTQILPKTPGKERCSMNSGGYGDVFQCQTTGVSRRARLLRCEELARTKLQKKAYDYEDLLELVQILPLSKLRRGKSQRRADGTKFEYFVGGMFTHGPFVGLTRTCKESFVDDQVHQFLHSLPGSWGVDLFRLVPERRHWTTLRLSQLGRVYHQDHLFWQLHRRRAVASRRSA